MQRFQSSLPGQKCPFAAHVSFVSIEEIHDTIRSLLGRYWLTSGKGEDPSNGDGDSNGRNHFDKSFVVDVFVALFCNREQFKSATTAVAFLNTAQPDKDEEMLRTLSDWAQEIVDAHLDGGSTVAVEASTLEELLWALQPYRYTLKGDDGPGTVSPWPLVSGIHFGLDHPLLNAGVSFVDTPSLCDTNIIRSNLAVRVRRECNVKITVAEIACATDNTSLHENLQLGEYGRGSGNAILVITRGDSIDSDIGVAANDLERKTILQLCDEVKRLAAERKLLSAKRTLHMTRAVKDQTEDRLTAISIESKEKREECNVRRMTVRNRSVLQKIRSHYKVMAGETKPLHAFVVGNDAYGKYQAGCELSDKPTMSVEQTGIPALRQSVWMFSADSTLADALQLATVQLPNLLVAFELYCAQTHLSRRSVTKALIEETKGRIMEMTSGVLDRMKAEARHEILDRMKVSESTWTEQATTLCRQWAIKHFAHHLSLLNKEGFRKGDKSSDPDIDWNAELMLILRQQTQNQFLALQNVLHILFVEFWHALRDLLVKTAAIIRSAYSLRAVST